MKNDKFSAEFQKEVKDVLAKTKDKAEAIYQAAVMIAEEQHKGFIDELVEQNARAAADEDYGRSLGLAVLSEDEKKFYSAVTKDFKQAINANQIDILPTSIVDRTLADVRKKSSTLSLVKMAPAGVKKWIIGSHFGAAVWGNLTAEIEGELSAEIKGLNIESCKLMVYLVIPKAIRDLALPFVDKYFTAILGEAMHDGLVDGYLNGNGKTGPIGITKKIEAFETDGTASDKAMISTVTKFSPKGLAEVRKILSNNGKRVVTQLELICNPLDEVDYVDPALFGYDLVGEYRNTSFMPIVKHVEPKCPQGKGIFTIKDAYTMGCTGVKLNEYDQTKAMEDKNLIIGKAYANGRADDDNAAVVFDITKLEEYVLPLTLVTNV